MSTPESENNRDEYTPPPGAPRWWRREDSSLVRFAAGTVTRFAVGCVLPIAAIVYFVFPYIKELSESSNRPRPPQEAPVVQEEGVVSQPEEEPPAPPKEEYRRPPLLPFKDCEHSEKDLQDVLREEVRKQYDARFYSETEKETVAAGLVDMHKRSAWRRLRPKLIRECIICSPAARGRIAAMDLLNGGGPGDERRP